MDKKKEAQKTTNKEDKLKNKSNTQIEKIEKRIKNVKDITQIHEEIPEVKGIQNKFIESYNQRKGFSKDFLDAREKCTKLKDMVDEFLKQ